MHVDGPVSCSPQNHYPHHPRYHRGEFVPQSMAPTGKNVMLIVEKNVNVSCIQCKEHDKPGRWQGVQEISNPSTVRLKKRM